MQLSGLRHFAGGSLLGTPMVLGGQRVTMGAPTLNPRRRLGQAANMVEALRTRGPIIPVQVGIGKAMAEKLRSQGQTPPAPEEIPAMVDTGASITAINVPTAQRLGLIQTSTIQIGGATGVSTMPLYGGMVRFTDPPVEFGAMQIGGANLGAPYFEMLIGRDILCSMHLAYDGRKGQFTLIT